MQSNCSPNSRKAQTVSPHVPFLLSTPSPTVPGAPNFLLSLSVMWQQVTHEGTCLGTNISTQASSSLPVM